MRRLLISVLVLVVLLIVADRVAVVAAQRDVADRIQVDQHLRSTPTVTIGGFPFLSQLVGGTYDDVTVTVHGLSSGALRVHSLTAHLHGAHVSFRDVISQHVSRVPVDRATATVELTYADLDADLVSKGFRVTAGPGRTVRLAPVASGSPPPPEDARVDARGNALVLTPTTSALPAIEIPLTGLPFNIDLTAVKVTQKGIVVSGVARGLVLRT